MSSRSIPDSSLMGVPSLHAIKAFLAAAKYHSFTDAARALCVTQAAVSKQVRELEAFLGVTLFVRAGRTVRLTLDGAMYRDTAQLSFNNLMQASNRLRRPMASSEALTVCCSPAFSALWLQRRLPEFYATHPSCEITVLVTQDFRTLEAGAHPDVVIGTRVAEREGYTSSHLLDDLVYPVCSPGYLERHGPLAHLQDLSNAHLLDISPYGRSQISEHLDWSVWLTLHGLDASASGHRPNVRYRSNDYAAVIQLALTGQGVALGWNHLVDHLVENVALVRPIPQALVLNNRSHYLAVRKEQVDNPACREFTQWVTGQCHNY